MPDHELQPKAVALRRALSLLLLAVVFFPSLLLIAQDTNASAKNRRWGDFYLRQRPEWYATAEARRIADNLLHHQSQVGGWPKSVDFVATPTPQSLADAVSGGRANSLDNDATTMPMQFLARIAQATGDDKYRQSFALGLDYLFAAQYPNGGWPQFFPLREGYYSHITYNDGAMIHALTLLRDVAAGQPPYDFVDATRRAKAAAAVAKGIDCILRTQIKQDGKPTAWCAQHDEKTLAPAWARNYEIPSLSGAESVGIVRFLMAIESPTPEIIAAVEGAVAWLKSVTITGLRYERGTKADGIQDGWVTPDPNAGPLWARFYELGSNRPIFTGRDKIVRYSLSEIERERRGGYAFYADAAESLLARDYPRWAAKNANAPTRNAASSATPAGKSASKPRVIATTDGEIDDHSSMIRFLLYTCDFDVAGILEVNSKFQKNGHSKEPWLENQLAAYEQVLPNLRKHNPDYPSAEYLRSVCRVGNENIKDLWVAPPEMETKNTAGEKLIIDTLLDSDPRPVHVLSWGGANTTASALWKLKAAYPKDKFDYAVSRIRIYCIWYQDGGGGWIQTNIPQAHINEAYRWDNVWDYESYDNARGKERNSSNPPRIQEYMKPAWVNENVITNHGPLGALCPQKYISEGDTPSFLHLINNGLNAHEDYTLGGWGGRSAYDDPAFPNHITDKTLTDDGDRNKMYWRWIPAAQNDFAARLDWCVKEFKDANHAPVAKAKGALKRDVKPGETVKLEATATDPDGNKLTCKWWQYADADSATATVAIANADSLDKASFVAPSEPGKQVHIILEVTDSGIPPLTSYQRVICNIK
jgi:PelA/Pel-15E family pectate lyase